jgi:GR25 family glycosyltransferase involved in LPS biosynthesis
MNFKIIKKQIINNLPVILLISVIIIIILFKILTIFLFSKNQAIEKFENNNGINNIDKILFINLTDRKDRLESITSELKKQYASENKIQRINAHYTPGNGHLGCSKSHYDAMQYAIDNNLNNVAVFEDDFIFGTTPDETNKLFNKLFNNLNSNEWDVIMFTYSFGNLNKTQYSFLDKITEAQSGAGYLVNKHYFKTLQDVFKLSADNMNQKKTTKTDYEPYALDQVWKNNQKKDKWFCFNPKLGNQNDKSTSTIQSITNYK